MRRFGTVLILTTLFFTACSPDQAVKNYYRSYLTGDYCRAARYAASSEQEAYRMFGQQLRPEEKKRLHKRKVRVRDVSTEALSDTSMLATCTVLLKEPQKSEDTLYRLVQLKKEGRRWKVSSGVWSER